MVKLIAPFLFGSENSSSTNEVNGVEVNGKRKAETEEPAEPPKKKKKKKGGAKAKKEEMESEANGAGGEEAAAADGEDQVMTESFVNGVQAPAGR